MTRHTAMAAVLAAGVLLQTGIMMIQKGSMLEIRDRRAETEWMEVSGPGKPVIVPRDERHPVRPLEPVRGLLFFRRMELRSVAAEDLAALPGIGESLAGRIVELRDGLGRPLTWTDLDNLDGVGEKTLLGLRQYVDIR